jgi:hypothetical protein
VSLVHVLDTIEDIRPVDGPHPNSFVTPIKSMSHYRHIILQISLVHLSTLLPEVSSLGDRDCPDSAVVEPIQLVKSEEQT